jgi:hypothetical protein
VGNALQRLIDDVELRRHLGAQARAIAETRFGNKQIAALVKRVYADLLGSVA